MSIYLDKDAEKEAVLTLGGDIGFGRVIQLAHQCWDEMLEAKHGIKNHSESWTLAAAENIRERRAAPASPESLGVSQDEQWKARAQSAEARAEEAEKERDDALKLAEQSPSSWLVREKAEAQLQIAREALEDTVPSLFAAVSLLRVSPKTGAPSNRMFDQMVLDYEGSARRAAQALAELSGKGDLVLQTPVEPHSGLAHHGESQEL